ncbi:hypothetical protein BDR26DRAFT_850013 [Obelidium mucronatum]|nr:hypothetical protein BDR26DRAFT_850013 [Obelidium mucronatum]
MEAHHVLQNSAACQVLLAQKEQLVDEGILHQQDEHRDTLQMSVEARRERFVRTVKAIGFIVDNRLYRLVAKGVEAYFKTRWNMRRAQSYRFVMCGSVFKALAGLEDALLPHRERLCRTLKKRAMFKGPLSLRAVWLAALQVAEHEEVTSTVLAAVDDTLPDLMPDQLPLNPKTVRLVKDAWEKAQRRPKPKNPKSSSSAPQSLDTLLHSPTGNSAACTSEKIASSCPVGMFTGICPAKQNEPSTPEDTIMTIVTSRDQFAERSRSNSGDSTAAPETLGATSAPSSLESSAITQDLNDIAAMMPGSFKNSFLFEKITPRIPERSTLAQALEKSQAEILQHSTDATFFSQLSNHAPNTSLGQGQLFNMHWPMEFPIQPHQMSLGMPFDYFSTALGMSHNSSTAVQPIPMSGRPSMAENTTSGDRLSVMLGEGVDDLDTLFATDLELDHGGTPSTSSTTPSMDVNDGWIFDFTDSQTNVPFDDVDFVHLLGITPSGFM